MKSFNENRIYVGLLIMFLSLLSASILYGELRQQELMKHAKAHVPLVVDEAHPKKQAYVPGEILVGVFTGERFTNASSVLIRQVRCSNGYRLPQEIPVAGRPVGIFVNKELQLIRIPEAAGGACNIRFSETFNEVIDGIPVSNTIVYEFDFTVL